MAQVSNKMSKVSIIVPIYNVEKYVSKCLDSLIRQTFSDIEILAVSDGSPDNSKEIVLKYAEKDKRVKFIEKENGGYGSVLETAIARIESEYFMVCDPDDWLSDDAVEVLVNTLTKNDVDMVVGCKYLVYNDNEEKIYTDSVIHSVNINTEFDKVYTDLTSFYYLDPSPHAKLYKTSICKGIKLPHKVSFTDLLLYTYALENAEKAIYIKDALSYYLIDRPGNSMSTFKDKTFYDHYVIMSELFNYAHDGNNKMLYARTYIQFRYALSQLVEHGADSAKLKYFNEYWNIYKTLIRHKKDVMNNYPKDGTLSKLKCAFLLSGLFEKTMLKDLMGAK